MKKWLKVLFVSGALAVTGVLACTGTSRGYTRVCAEGEETSEVVEEPVSNEENEKWAKQAWETYVVPLFASVSLTSIGSLVGCFLITLLKNKQLNKKLIAMQEEADRREEKANEKLLLAEQKLAEVTEILQTVRELAKIIIEDHALNKEIKREVIEKLTLITQVIEKNGQDISKINKLQEVIALLVQLEAKVSLQATEVIKSGIVDDVNKILQLVKSI